VVGFGVNRDAETVFATPVTDTVLGGDDVGVRLD